MSQPEHSMVPQFAGSNRALAVACTPCKQRTRAVPISQGRVQYSCEHCRVVPSEISALVEEPGQCSQEVWPTCRAACLQKIFPECPSQNSKSPGHKSLHEKMILPYLEIQCAQESYDTPAMVVGRVLW